MYEIIGIVTLISNITLQIILYYIICSITVLLSILHFILHKSTCYPLDVTILNHNNLHVRVTIHTIINYYSVLVN